MAFGPRHTLPVHILSLVCVQGPPATGADHSWCSPSRLEPANSDLPSLTRAVTVGEPSSAVISWVAPSSNGGVLPGAAGLLWMWPAPAMNRSPPAIRVEPE